MRKLAAAAAILTSLIIPAAAIAASIGGVTLNPPAPYVSGSGNGAIKIIGGQASTNTDGTGKLQITVYNSTPMTYNRPWLFQASDTGVIGGAGVIAGSNVWLGSPTGVRISAKHYPTTTGYWYVTLNYRIPLDGLPHSITVYEDQASMYNYNPATAVAILRYDLVAS